ncbi:ORF6N domain-containing protein [Clostridium diolis]|nr:ORF6N domain-containing protein [Clostridium diolis]
MMESIKDLMAAGNILEKAKFAFSDLSPWPFYFIKKEGEKMKNLIKINNHVLQIKEFNNQRVVTFKDIDLLHDRIEGTAKSNFYENKKHFIENEDYFIIPKSLKCEIPTLKVPNRGITVLTESGYLMLVKSLQDDLAWKVQRELVNNYFRIKNFVNVQKSINEIKVQLETQFNEMVQVKINEIESKCSNYYRPSSLEKSNISRYIKQRLGILKADEEYESVKQRVLLKLGANKWEDVPIETLKDSLNIIDESIRVVKLDRPQQYSM